MLTEQHDPKSAQRECEVQWVAAAKTLYALLREATCLVEPAERKDRHAEKVEPESECRPVPQPAKHAHTSLELRVRRRVVSLRQGQESGAGACFCAAERAGVRARTVGGALEPAAPLAPVVAVEPE